MPLPRAARLLRPPPPLPQGSRGSAAPACRRRRYNSVVKIFTTSSSPNYQMPWSNKPHRESTGSGFAIAGRRLLTNAHVVADAAHCQVRRHGDAARHTARVVGISHECDLAVIEVEDESFWQGLQPLSFGSIPALQEAVTVPARPPQNTKCSPAESFARRAFEQQKRTCGQLAHFF